MNLTMASPGLPELPEPIWEGQYTIQQQIDGDCFASSSSDEYTRTTLAVKNYRQYIYVLNTRTATTADVDAALIASRKEPLQ